MMRAGEIAAMLADRAREVATMLLPQGKLEGREWCAGSIDGEAGKSLKVCTSGNKAGVWSDFASGGGGDLLDLWCAVRNRTMAEALSEAREYLGVREQRIENPRPSYKRPTRDGLKPLPSPITEWLTAVRKISAATIAKYKLVERRGALMFPYLRDGELIAAKYRKAPAKEFFVDAGCEPCLFGWHGLTGRERGIALVEGEMDVLAMAEYGFPALSVPFGGGKEGKQTHWIETEFDRLAQFDVLYLALDQDGEGQAATQEIAKRLGRERCRLVELPRKDANQCLIDGIPQADILRALEAAQTQDPEQLQQASEYADALVAEFAVKIGNERGIRLPWNKAGDSVILRLGEVSLWLGINGHGKSQGMGHVTLGALEQDVRCCVASMEFRAVKWLKRMVRQASGISTPGADYVRQIADWFHDKLWVFNAAGATKVSAILEVFAYAARRYGVQFFLIDNLAKCGFAEDDYSGQKAFADRLTDFARDFDVHVALVHHMRKGESEDKPGGKMDSKGSGGVADMVDTCAVWWRNKPKERAVTKANLKREEVAPEVAGKPDGLLIFDKQRNGEEEPTFALWFDRDSLQFLAHARQQPKRYVQFERSEAA